MCNKSNCDNCGRTRGPVLKRAKAENCDCENSYKTACFTVLTVCEFEQFSARETQARPINV